MRLLLLGNKTYCQKIVSHFLDSEWLKVSEQLPTNPTAEGLATFIENNTDSKSTVLLVSTPQQQFPSLPAALNGQRVAASIYFPNLEDTEQWSIKQKLQTSENARPPWAILAQWSPFYIQQATAWLNALKTQDNLQLKNYMANQVGKVQLLKRLTNPIQVCVYFGHGSHQKIKGYHGISAQEILEHTSNNNIKAFISFACYHLADDAESPTFGHTLVNQQRVDTFFASRIATDKQLSSSIETTMLDNLPIDNASTLANWVQKTDLQLSQTNDKTLHETWQSYSIYGNPITYIR